MENLDSKIISTLIEQAFYMLNFSYAPYSNFHVGAALLTQENKVYTGCNIENASYGATNCAERTAFFKAVSEGEKKFSAIAIVGGPKGQVTDFCPPCGICRQVMREFCSSDFKIILAKSPDSTNPENYKIYTLDQFLPQSFGPDNL